MKLLNNVYFFVLIFLLLFIVNSCSKTNDAVVQNLKPEIINTKISDGDVNNPNFWENTKIVWNDEFDGANLSTENWNVETSLAGVGYAGWQNFTGEGNIEVSDGALKIISKKTGTGQKLGDYTSARINSAVAFTYGRLEVRAKLPGSDGSGLWSRLILLGNNIGTVGYPKCGQISLMEYTSHTPNNIFNTVHTATNVLSGEKKAANSGFIPLETANEEFHIYGILWTNEYLRFYIDDIENVSYSFLRPSSPNSDNWPFSKSFFFAIDTSIGSEFADGNGVDDSIFPTSLEIDYVRVYHVD